MTMGNRLPSSSLLSRSKRTDSNKMHSNENVNILISRKGKPFCAFRKPHMGICLAKHNLTVF